MHFGIGIFFSNAFWKGICVKSSNILYLIHDKELWKAGFYSQKYLIHDKELWKAGFLYQAYLILYLDNILFYYFQSEQIHFYIYVDYPIVPYLLSIEIFYCV